MSDNYKKRYVDLKINGRLFPSWILMNFKRFKLSPVIIKEGVDPCNVQKTSKKELRKYQEFLTYFLDYKSPHKDILIYHGLGSGKTVTAINVYNMLYNYTPGWNIFIIIPASLKNDPWLKDINNWLSKDEFKDRFQNIIFVHYDSPFADRDFMNAIKKADSSKKNMYIFDEAHNFIKNVYNNINSKAGKRAHVIYDYIQREKMENDEIRIILLTGTPAVNTPFEIALVYNLLRPKSFPMSETKFKDLYIKNNLLNPEKKNMFQRRILGLTSYYLGTTRDLFAKKVFKYKNIPMSKYQTKVYEHYEYIENIIKKQSIQNKTQSTVYKSYTRQSSNFVFPVMTSKMNGETRPRPKDFKINEKDANKLMEMDIKVILKNWDKKYIEKPISDDKKKEITEIDRKKNTSDYNIAMQLYVSEFKKYLNKISSLDKKNKNTLSNDIMVFKTKYKMKFIEFMQNYKKKSNLLKSLYDCSCKMTAIMFYILRSKGPILIYSNYVAMEGIELLKIYLSYFGYSDYNSKNSYDYFRYVEYHGSIDRDLREKNRNAFNLKTNTFGKNVKIILVSPAGSEGISLLNVKQVHVLEPYWNEVRIQQLIGRAIRGCSHKDLPMNERFVDIFRYKAIRLKGNKTTDEEMEELAKNKKILIDSFLKVIKEASVDCELFKNHNMMEEEYKCFKFNETDFFNKNPGPAFKEDIYYDSKLNNGLNSTNSITKKIKVIKINAVKKINNNFSDVYTYWYNPETGVVYDYELDYPIGKVLIEDNIPEKMNKDTYIISDIIPIPVLKRK
jgi:superfamily II DNA or RNA helicase